MDNGMPATVSSNSAPSTKNTLLLTAKKIWNSITIEPMMFLMSISFMTISLYVGSLTLFKICYVQFQHNETICKNLPLYPKFEAEAQKVASNYSIYSSVIDMIPSLVFVLFFGQWSDRFGRKIPLLIGLGTHVISSLFYILAAEIKQLHPLFMLLCPLITSIFGGAMAIEIAIFSYITDITDEKTRTITIAILGGISSLGLPLGTLLSGVLLKYGGYSCVFGVGSALFTICFLYTICWVKESHRPTEGEQIESKGFLRDLFNIKNVREGFVTFFKTRPGNKHLQLWTLECCQFLLAIPASGAGSIFYLYTRLKFKWTDTTFSYFITATLTINCLVSMFLIPFLIKHARVKDPYLCLLGLASQIVSDIIISVSTASWMLFAASLVLLNSCAGAPIRSLMTKCVEPNEVGKLFSVTAVFQCLIPIVSSTVYTQTYNATMHTFPGTVFVISCAFYALAMPIMAYVAYEMEKETREADDKEIVVQESEIDQSYSDITEK